MKDIVFKIKTYEIIFEKTILGKFKWSNNNTSKGSGYADYETDIK